MFFQRFDFRSNPVVLILVCVLTFIYIVVVLLARRLDARDQRRMSVVPLCGLDGAYKYEVTVVTGKRKGAGKTDVTVFYRSRID